MKTLKASSKGLDKIKKAIEKIQKEKGWTLDKEYWLDEASQFLPMVKQRKQEVRGSVSIATWNRFRNNVGVKSYYFQAFCQVLQLNWEEVVDKETSQPTPLPVSSRQDWGAAPTDSNFFGRTDELATLKGWIISDCCKLVALLGMGGIGKTTLSVNLAQQIQGEFDYIIWRTLRNAPPVQQVLADLIEFLSNQQKTNLPEEVSAQISLLITEYLQKHRCLIVLDNAESILQIGTRAGQYREGYEGYGELFQHLGETSHQSCLLLTSRENIKEIAFLAGEKTPVRVRQLPGLNGTETKAIFEIKGGFSGSEAEWKELGDRYAGNPLALKLVAPTIQDLYSGNIPRFLNEGVAGIDDLVDQLYRRLSPLEKEVMYWLAINREPVGLAELESDIISPVSRQKLQEAMESLSWRSLIEKRPTGFTQLPVVMEQMTNRLIDQIFAEIKVGNIDFLNNYALIKAQAPDYIREVQIRFILKPFKERLLKEQNSKNLETKLFGLLSTIRTQSSLPPGYTAGNIINLLSEGGTDLSGYDFSSLTIWQAYLQGMKLHNANFTDSDLGKSVLTQKMSSIVSLALSPDGKYLATGDANGEIHLWQILDGKQLRIYRGHIGWVRSVAFSPDSKLLVSGSDDCTVRLWDVNLSRCLKESKHHTSIVHSIAFSPDGRTVVSGSDDFTVKLWDVNTGQSRDFGKQDLRVRGVAFSPDGKLVASAGDDSTIKLWNVDNGKCLHNLQGHQHWVSSVCFSPNGEDLVSGSDDGTVKLWDIETGENLMTFRGHTDFIWSVGVSPDAQKIISGSGDGTVKVWDVDTGECLKTLEGHKGFIWSVGFSSNGYIIASGSDDQTAKLWDVQTGRCLRNFQGYSNWFWSVAFSPDGKKLVSGSGDNAVRLWDLQTGQCLRTLRGHNYWVWSVRFSPDGKKLVSSSGDGTLKLWDAQTGQCVKTFEGHLRSVWSVAFSPDGLTLASGSVDKTAKLWDISSGNCIQTLTGHLAFVWPVAFSPNGEILVSGSGDHTIRVWNARTGECLNVLQGHSSQVQSVAFSPDGTKLASASGDRTIKIWNISTGECLKTLTGHTSWVWAVAFSPNGGTLASGSGDNTVKLWDIGTGECCRTLRGHTHVVSSVAFSPDSKILATGSQDETMKFWDVQTGDCRETLTVERPYEGMNITGVRGINKAQKDTLIALGSVEESQ